MLLQGRDANISPNSLPYKPQYYVISMTSNLSDTKYYFSGFDVKSLATGIVKSPEVWMLDVKDAVHFSSLTDALKMRKLCFSNRGGDNDEDPFIQGGVIYFEPPIRDRHLYDPLRPIICFSICAVTVHGDVYFLC